MKRKSCMILISCILSLLFCSCTSVQVRPMTVKVVDKVTRAPLANIPVYYGIETRREEPAILFFIPNPYPRTYKIEKGEMGHTDSTGEVSFGPHEFLLRKTERINREILYINLDLNDRTRRAHFQVNLHDSRNVVKILDSFGTGFSRLYMMNPVSGYRGAFISSQSAPADRPGQGEIADIIRNTQGLQEKEQLLVIELGRN